MKLTTTSNNKLIELIETINVSLPSIVRKSHYFRKDSQHSLSFQSLTMLNGQHPMRVLRQILAEISNKRSALLEASSKLISLEESIETADNLTKKVVLESQLTELRNAINNTIKDVGTLVVRYNQIEKKHNIKDWTESDFEEAESSFHVRRGFELLYQNLIQFGRPDKSTVEYLQQYGIHPQVATKEVAGYMTVVEQHIENKNYIGSSHLEDFLDEMAKKYKENPKDVSERLFGIRDLVIKETLLPTIENVSETTGLDVITDKTTDLLNIK